MREFRVAIKGPLTSSGGRWHSLAECRLRQIPDSIPACDRYHKGVPSPVKHPERMNLVIFRENTEDVYAGIQGNRNPKRQN